VAGCLGSLAISGAALRWVRRYSLEVSPETLALYQSLDYPAGKQRPLLQVSPRVRRPVLVGVGRPRILIPAALELPTAAAREQLRLGLLHELAHAEAADPWFGLLANLAQAFWFVVPPLWWIGGWIRIDQEFLADHRAALRFGRRISYASSLVDIASQVSDGPITQKLPAVPEDRKGSSSPLFLRVLMLIRCPFPIEERPPRWWRLGTVCLAAIMTLGVSVIAIRPHRATASVYAAHINGSQIFRMARLSVPAIPPNDHGRVLPFELPIALPDQFELTLEVWAKVADLGRTRVAGLPLVFSTAIARPELIGWHKVEIHRLPGVVDLTIDGENVHIPSPPETFLTQTLSFEPAPDATGLFRNLTLHW
jgi:BlaR1 peptidase M56